MPTSCSIAFGMLLESGKFICSQIQLYLCGCALCKRVQRNWTDTSERASVSAYYFVIVTSKYPVILSIEDQTTGEQKGQVCIILNQILDKALYCPQEDHQKTYLSPHNLREKFIPIYSKKYNVPCHKTPLPQVDLKKDYNDHINIDYPSAMINVSERSRKISTDKCINWAQKQMVRVYPHGLRIFSDNFCPQSLWKEGVQMVALNYQTDDKYMRLNQQMFAQNGKCGYILKPKELRPAQPIVWDQTCSISADDGYFAM